MKNPLLFDTARVVEGASTRATARRRAHTTPNTHRAEHGRDECGRLARTPNAGRRSGYLRVRRRARALRGAGETRGRGGRVSGRGTPRPLRRAARSLRGRVRRRRHRAGGCHGRLARGRAAATPARRRRGDGRPRDRRLGCGPFRAEPERFVSAERRTFGAVLRRHRATRPRRVRARQRHALRGGVSPRRVQGGGLEHVHARGTGGARPDGFLRRGLFAARPRAGPGDARPRRRVRVQHCPHLGVQRG